MVERFGTFASTEFDLVLIDHLAVLSLYAKAVRLGQVTTAKLLWELCHVCGARRRLSCSFLRCHTRQQTKRIIIIIRTTSADVSFPTSLRLPPSALPKHE